MNKYILCTSLLFSIFLISCNTSTNSKTEENSQMHSNNDSAISNIMKNPAALNQMTTAMMEQCEKDSTLYGAINNKILGNYSMMLEIAESLLLCI